MNPGLYLLETFQQPLAPVGGSLTASALVGLLPLLVVFLLLGVAKTKAWVAALAGLGTAVLVAVIGFKMPLGLTILSASEGAAYGLFPIQWIVINAILIYQLAVTSGRFEYLRDTFNAVSEDPRVQSVLIAFCFGGLLEALAGFGAPVAITATMIIALGVAPLRAAAAVLIANTAPVAFGSLAIPITTAAGLTGLPAFTIGAMTGRQAPFLALFVPMLLVLIVDGFRGLRETWPVALVTGASFALTQFLISNFVSTELTDIVAALVGLGVAVVFLRFWQPQGSAEARERLSRECPTPPPAIVRSSLTPGRVLQGLFPYLLVIGVFSFVNLAPGVKQALAATDVKIHWPWLDGSVLDAAGKAVATTTFKLNWLGNPGTLLLICCVVVALVFRISPRLFWRDFTGTLYKLRWAILTVASVLSLAYVMNLSGQTISIGTWIAGTGLAFAFLSPVLGWIGTAVTGSDTSANALFSKLQQTAGNHIGIDPNLLVAANTTGGVVGKMISPQNLSIAAASVGLDGGESALFRKMLPWSLGILLALCTLVFLQATVLSWMVP